MAEIMTGRCYCGRTTLRAEGPPQVIAYCHCVDCRRISGAPVAAFAGFAETVVTFAPDEGTRATSGDGVRRTFCPDCGSPLTGRYAYLPDQVYIPLGLLDQADQLAPQLHAHAESRLPWLCLTDDLPKIARSAREDLVSTPDISEE